MPAHVLVRLVQHTREGVVILTLAVAILRAHVDMQRQRWRGLTKSRHAGINRRDAFSRARIHMLAACTHRATIGKRIPRWIIRALFGASEHVQEFHLVTPTVSSQRCSAASRLAGCSERK